MKKNQQIAAVVLLLLTIAAAPLVDKMIDRLYDNPGKPPAEPPKIAEAPPQPVPEPLKPEPPKKETQAQVFTIKGRGNYAVKVKESFDGGPGWDTIKMEGAGWISLDGVQIRNIEMFKVKNGRQNMVYIYANGVNSLDEGSIVVEGEIVDTVWLDADILWDKPVTDMGYRHYNGITGRSKRVTVSVSPDIRVKMGND